MGRNVTYTRASGNYTGAAGVVNARTRIASWQVVNPRGVMVGPQAAGEKTLVAFIQSTVPAHIATGTVEVVIEGPNHESDITIGVFRRDAAAVPTTLAIATNQDTAMTYDGSAKGNFGDYISLYFTSATASVDANCTYQIPVREL